MDKEKVCVGEGWKIVLQESCLVVDTEQLFLSRFMCSVKMRA